MILHLQRKLKKLVLILPLKYLTKLKILVKLSKSAWTKIRFSESFLPDYPPVFRNKNKTPIIPDNPWRSAWGWRGCAW